MRGEKAVIERGQGWKWFFLDAQSCYKGHQEQKRNKSLL